MQDRITKLGYFGPRGVTMQVKKCGVDTNGEHAEREPITGICMGAEPQRGPGTDSRWPSPPRGDAPVCGPSV